jgi:hypothetical protein
MNLSRVGIGLSFLCAIHCAAVPFLIGLALCSEGSGLASPRFENGMVGITALVGSATLAGGFRRHRRALPLAMLGTGLVVMFTSSRFLEEPWEVAGVVAGALVLVAAQVLNGRCSRACCPARCCAAADPVPEAALSRSDAGPT